MFDFSLTASREMSSNFFDIYLPFNCILPSPYTSYYVLTPSILLSALTQNKKAQQQKPKNTKKFIRVFEMGRMPSDLQPYFQLKTVILTRESIPSLEIAHHEKNELKKKT